MESQDTAELQENHKLAQKIFQLVKDEILSEEPEVTAELTEKKFSFPGAKNVYSIQDIAYIIFTIGIIIPSLNRPVLKADEYPRVIRKYVRELKDLSPQKMQSDQTIVENIKLFESLPSTEEV